MFNIFHEEPMTFADKNSKDIVVDINPINVDKSGKIDDKLAEMDSAYFQSAMKRSSFNNFEEFYNNVLTNKQNNNKEQFNYLSKQGLNIRIPHDTIIHDKKRHQLTSAQWLDLLKNIDDSDSAISKQKSSYSGKPVLLKIVTSQNVFGVVLETFSKIIQLYRLHLLILNKI